MIKYFNVTFGETIENPYKLPIASSETLGGIKIGEGLNIDENGVVSVSTIKINQSTINIGEQSTIIDYTGVLIGLMAWQDGKFVLTNLNCNINDNTITFNINTDVDTPIECIVIYY